MAEARILIVEDQNIIVLDLRKRLTNLGYVVVGTLAYGEEVVATAAEVEPDLILMDIVLKGAMDGVQAAAEVRGQLDLPVIFLTAHSDERTVKRATLTEPYGYILKPFQDRELQMAIEIGLYKHQMERKLRESQRWLAATLKSMGDAVIATDIEKRVRFMNPVAEALTGWPQAKAAGRELSEVFKVHCEETGRRMSTAVTGALHGGVAVGPTRPVILMDRNGHKLPVEETAAPIRDQNGQITGVVLVFRDISERRRTEATLRGRERQLEIVNNMTRAALATSSLPATCQILADSLASLLGGDRCHIVQWDEATQSATEAAANSSSLVLLSAPEAAGLTASTLGAGHAVVLGAARGTVLGLPLEAGDSKWGAALIAFAGSHDVTAEEAALGEQAAGLAALAVTKAGLLQSERAARETAETLQAASMALTHTLDLDTVLTSLLEYLGHLIPYDTANTMLFEGGTKLVVKSFRRQDHLADGGARLGRDFEIKDFATFRSLVATQKSLLIPDTAAFPGWINLSGSEYIRSWLGVPLVADGSVIGVYSMNKAQPGFFTEGHARLAEAVAAQTAVAVQNARLFEQVRAGRERLQALSQQLVEAQEAERRHLARELHDDVGQTLTGLKLLLESVPGLPREAASAKLEAATNLVGEVMGRVHDISLALRPDMLDDLGLRPALFWLFERYTAQTGIRVQPELVGVDSRLQPAHETAIYRVVQEALANVARHAKTDQVWVRLLVEEAQIRLQIEDEGIGFDVNNTLARSRRMGLSGMRERASLLGGQVRFGSRPGEGTWVSMVLPRTGRLERRGDDRFDPAG